MKNIIVNATSATIGGSLTILNQFIENIDNGLDKSKKYYIFVPVTSILKSFDNVVIVPIKAKKYADRIKWDLYGMKKWCKKNDIKPNLIVSLQNTAVAFRGIPQIVYLHQPLPYAKESSWNILKKDERKMWFYKHIYKIWINLSVQKHHYIVVQTEWMKEAIAKSGYNENKIIVSKPKINPIDINKVNKLDKKNKKYLFYPAADYKYKNHNIIVEAVRILSEKDPQIVNDIRVIFTLDKEVNVYDKIIKYGLEDTIKMIGHLKYEDVLSYYRTSDIILFPSYIETFGLPLVEASYFGKTIVVSDCSYSREVLDGYKMVDFVKYNDAINWSNAIVENLRHNNMESEIRYNTNCENGWGEIFSLIDSIV